jgi:hypothetical protein
MVGFDIGGSVTFSHSLATCPKCGGDAEIVDGTYEAFGSKLKVFLAPTVSLEARAAILELAIALQEARISVAEAIMEAEKIDHRFGGIFDIADWSDQAKAILLGSILASAATVAVAAATIAAPYFAPTPTVVVQMAPPSAAAAPHLRERLLSGTSQAPLHRAAPQAPK